VSEGFVGFPGPLVVRLYDSSGKNLLHEMFVEPLLTCCSDCEWCSGGYKTTTKFEWSDYDL